MIKWSKYLSISFLILLFVMLIVIHVGDRMMQYSDEETYDTFSNSGVDVEVIYSDNNGTKYRTVVESKQSTDSVLIVFAHGAPGSWDAFKDYMLDSLLSSKARMVSYDRPGYGSSSSKASPSIIDQAEILSQIIDTYRLPYVMLVGHSYGCPIVGYASSLSHNRVNKTIIIAPLIDPKSEPIFWFSYFSYWNITRWMLPQGFQTAGTEKFSHSKYLNEIKDCWKSSTSEITLIHGMKDGLAPPIQNIEFAVNNIPKDKLNLKIFEDNGHLIPFNDFTTVNDIILTEKETLKSNINSN